MNKYLEKLAFRVSSGQAALAGAIAGGAAGGWSGHRSKEKEIPVGFFKTKKVKKTEAERVLSGIGAGLGGAYLGAAAGLYMHPSTRAYRRQQYQRTGGSGSGRAGNEFTSRTIHDIHADLNMPKGGFKTKTEAKSHFRKTRSQYHPDKHPGKEKEMNERMAKFNRAWDEFEKHPEGFEKLANAYLYKLAAVDFAKVKHIVKQNPAPVVLGTLLGAEGLSSTTRKKNEHEGRFRLRQVRNTMVGVGTGAVAGKVVQEGFKHIKKD